MEDTSLKIKEKHGRREGLSAGISGWLLFLILLLYYEIMFHGTNFGLGDGNLPAIIAFSLAGSGVCAAVTGWPHTLANKLIATLLVIFIGVYFTAQYIYHSVFNNYMSLAGTLRFGNQAADNADTVMENVKGDVLHMLLLVIPMLLAVLCIWVFMPFARRCWWSNLSFVGGSVIVYAAVIMVLWAVDDDIYSPYRIYREYTSVDLATQKLGVMETFWVDIREGIAGGGHTDHEIQFASAGDVEKETTEAVTEAETAEAVTEEPEPVIDTSPNVLDIDFDELDELAGSDAVTSLSSYFQSLTPTDKNEYTGMFEGCNVIWITAEGYSGYALESGLFPTLEKLTNEGFVFENYYQPLWYGSTLGGEYANLMGSPTKNGSYLSMCRAADNEDGMIFSMGNTLKRLGYSCYAFHDNDYTYYDRDETHPALGYEWIASGHGLEYQKSESGADIWPQSDVVMLEETFDKYTDEEPFHLYYLTVSGHVPYTFSYGNYISMRNEAVVENLEYETITKAYLAAQYELELMLEEMMDLLEEKDLLDNTVIVIAGDHVPYDNMEVLDDLAGHELEDAFEAYRSSLVIWSGSLEEPVKVDKVCSSIDILPTMLNLMGAEYDSRLIIGRDILSDSDGLVLFADRSFITDEYEYSAATGAAAGRTSGDVDADELASMKLYVADKFTAADSITETGYYTYVARCMGWNSDAQEDN